VALLLKRNGIARVRPLQGGLALWMERQFPLEKMPAELRKRTLGDQEAIQR
jgi:3-mercaptopyruvate sulfurtransferase SseA